ncbi:MAG: type 4a pilus biogenesis protein PilO [Candidatus Saganbacteria bacterium]|nr:type 4a pilus biogenesis protein PilO [Candidatus Saganbacteria bacterium]
MGEFLSKRQNLIAGILIVLVLIYGTYNHLYKPKLREIGSLKSSLKLIDSEIKMIRGGDLLLKDLNATKVLLNKELGDLSKKIPSEAETPYLINNFISTVGKGLNIDYNLIQPFNLTEEQKFKRLPLKVEFVGNYADLNAYLAQLKRLPVTIRVDKMELRKVAGANKLAVSMMLSAFVMPGGAEKPPGTGKGYSYLYDPFSAEREKTKELKLEAVSGLRYSGYFMGREVKAIINDEVLKAGDSIQGFRILKIYKDRVVLVKNKKLHELILKEK